ncbi:MAG TPA: molybdopterin-dependent oxidoreductase [Burkholderiaceae bacterium]|jgi:assimilatory nitrate reductase catalytic subunit
MASIPIISEASVGARETRSTCPYCGVGCGVVIRTEGSTIVDVRGDPEHPANFGRLCTKGSTLHLTAAPHVSAQARLLQPMQRDRRGATPTAIAWDDALDSLSQRLVDTVRTHGPDAVGLYISGQLLTEDYYVFNKLAKGLLGTNNIDTNSRLCMSSAVSGYKATLGADAPPACYDDFGDADLVFITGSNLAWAHPILCRRLEDARAARPAQKWIVVDPRKTETAAMADLHLQILPGSDVALAHGLLHLMLWEGFTDAAFIRAHTSGFEALRDRVRECTVRETARATGLREEDIVSAARWWGGAAAVLSLYCQGLNQSAQGTANNASLINLHLATGQIGRPGAGPFSLTGQPNAMGGREVGGLANLLSAHRDLANPAHRAEVAALWGVDEVPSRPGKTAVEMFEAAADGEVKLLWIACTNPAQSLPDQATVRRAFERAEFVVLQEAFANTATARFADLLLPASTWGEKSGTVTNSERRISRVRSAVPAVGAARDDWRIVVDVARRVEARLRPRQPSLFAFDDAESVWNEHRETTRGRDLDITGLSYALIDRDGPQQWPYAQGATQGQARLYADGRFATANGRARFFDVDAKLPAEPRDARFPFSLTTGRLRDQWHGMSRTGTLGRLFGHVAEPSIDLCAQDMARLNLGDGDLVSVASRRGELVLPARRSSAQASAQAFIAMHWGEEVLTGSGAAVDPFAGINGLTTPAFCPQSKQPELKHCAVRIARANLPWRLRAMAWLPQDEALARRDRIRSLMAPFGYAACLPFGREPDAQGRLGLWLDAAAAEMPAVAQLDALRAELALSAEAVLDYRDPRTGVQRALRISRDAAGAERLQGFWICGPEAADAALSSWWRETLQGDLPLAMPALRMLAPGARDRQGSAQPASPQLCTCFNVSVAQASAALAAAPGDPTQRLAQTQAQLRCGTNCGSCLPHLRRLAQAAFERDALPVESTP